jgi:integrase
VPDAIGLRISEALALTKADVDFGRRLRVERLLANGELDAPKTRFGGRQVPLSRVYELQLAGPRGRRRPHRATFG